MSGQEVMENVREQCLKRGVSGIKGLARVFRNMDDNGSRNLDLEEFLKGLSDFGIALSDLEGKLAFEVCDKDKNGSLDFDEFLENLRPPMSQLRQDIVLEAYKKLDKTGDGVVTIDDLKGVYNAKEHPKYMNGEWTEEEVFLDFLKKYDSPSDPDGKVTKEEFLNYYSGLSASVDNDALFDQMIREAWKI